MTLFKKEISLYKLLNITIYSALFNRFLVLMLAFIVGPLYPLLTNNANGVVIRIDDITERVQIEKMMIDSVKMLTLGGLSTGLSTEINNPLSGILQNIQVIRNRFSADHEKNIKAASDCGISMEALISYL